MCWNQPQPFSKEPDITVVNPLYDTDVREPRVRYTGSQHRLIALTVVSEKMFSSINEVYETPIDRVIDAYHYIKFKSDFQTTAILMNKEQRWK